MPTGTATSFGQYHSAEPLANMTLVHRHDGVTPLREVDHEPKLGVLDQEDLFAQGIDTSVLVSGAPKVDALGSCTAQANTVGVSNLSDEIYRAYLLALGLPVPVQLFSDTVTGEKAAIRFYHRDSPWPAGGDNGSTGPKIVAADEVLKVVSTQRIAHTAQDIVSLLQTDGVLVGGPFLSAWMEPDANGFVDGNGSTSVLDSQIAKGVAGGHERYVSSVEKLVLSETGQVVPEQTVVRERNSWGASWGDHGSFRIHLSTYMALLAYTDFRQLVA